MNERACIIDAYLASEADPQELRDWLAEDPANVDRFTAACDIHWQLTEVISDRATSPKPRAAAKRTPGISPGTSGSRPTPFIIYPIAIAAALLFTAAIVGVYLLAFADPQPDPPTPTQPGPAVATLIENTGNLRTPHDYPAEGDDYGRGEYTLSSGTAEFMLTNAVNVKLRGESRMWMRNNMNVALTRGSAEFVVPKDAKGFTVHLPDQSKIVDLGTAFKVEVDEDGRTELLVTAGQVEWNPAESSEADAGPIRVKAGQVAWIAEDRSIRVTSANMITNGSFESTSRNPVVDYVRFPVGDNLATMPGWRVASPHRDFFWLYGASDAVRAHDGSNCINMTHLVDGGTLSQDFTVSAGVEYTVSWYAKARASNNNHQAQVTLDSGTASGELLHETSNLGSQWTRFSFSFIPDVNTVATLAFSPTNPSGVGSFLDNVRVNTPQVPNGGPASQSTDPTPSKTQHRQRVGEDTSNE